MKREWFRRNWHWITIIGVAVISFLVYLGWKHGIAISFAVLSIIVATFFASRSLKLTRDSLELTRATTRPFLTSRLGVELGNKPAINTQVRNTGIHPADNVIVTIELCAEPDGPSEEKILKQYTEPRGAVFFPNQELWYTMVIDAEDVKSIEAHKTYVRVAIDYQYRLSGTEHKTVETKRLTRHLTSRQIIHTVIPEKSSWY